MLWQTLKGQKHMTEEIKNPEIYENYNYETYAQFWKDIYHDTNYDGIIYFCGKTEENRFYNMHFCARHEVDEYLKTLQVTPVLNYYYSMNHFCKKKGVARSNANFFAACGTVVDIDFHNSRAKPEVIEKSLNIYLSKLESMVALGDAFPYNYVLKTGRGLQFVYIYQNNISFKLEIMHNRLQELILRQHQKIVTDNPDLKIKIDTGATKKKSGVYRMPGTYNTSNHKQVTITKTDYPFLDTSRIIDTYGFFDIVQLPVYEISNHYRSGTNPNNSLKRCFKYINIIKQYQSDGRAEQNHPGHENRTCTIFVLAHFLLEVMSYDNALEELIQFNNNYRVPLPEKRLKYMLDYCFLNYTDESKKRMRHLRNSTVLTYLGLEDGEYGIFDTLEKKKQAEKKRQHKKAQVEQRNTSIQEKYNAGVPYPTIAAELGISTKTVYRIIKKLYPNKKENQKPWERLGISKSTYYRRKKESEKEV